MFRFGLKKKAEHPVAKSTMKTEEEVTKELNLTRDKQMEAGRQGRKDLEAIHKARFEALLWVLGKEYASATVR